MVSVVARVAPVLFLAMIASSACASGGSSTDSTAPPALGPIPQLTNVENVGLPLNYYGPTPEQSVTISTADDILARDCMRRFGFDWPVPARHVERDPMKLWGISNEQDADKYGYHPNPNRYPVKSDQPGAAPSAAEQEVAMGHGPSSYANKQIPAGGGLGEAEIKLGFDVTVTSMGTEPHNFVHDLSLRASNKARTDQRTLDLWGKWSACMKKSGYDYRGPWDANDDPAWAASGDVPSRREITTAVADLGCRNSMNFAGVSDAIETAWQNQIIEQNAEALRAEKVKVDLTMPIGTKRLLCVVLTLISGAMLVAACGSSGNRPNVPPPLGPIPLITNAQNVSLPLDYYSPTPQQSATIATGREILWSNCMRRFGFDTPAQRNITAEPVPNKLWGISDEHDVAVYGYHPNPNLYPPTQVDPNRKPPSAAAQQVSTGVGPQSYNNQMIPKGGCTGDTDIKFGFDVTVTGEGLEMKELVLDLANQADAKARSDQRTLDLWGKWSACMRKSGYDYRGPWDANNDPTWTASDVPSQREIATAVADLRCRNSMNFAGVSDAIETAYQNQVIEQNAEALRAEKVKLDQRVKLATELVAQGH
jgi:hypothetical protein